MRGRDGVQRAEIAHRSAYLNTPFGSDYACKTFELQPADLEKIVGRYVRGKRKGELRGIIRWKHVVVGGWKRSGPGEGNGGVLRPGLRFDHEIVIIDAYRGEENVKWDMSFKEFGWIPGETRAQYDERQRIKREAERARIAAMTPEQIIAELEK